MNNFHILHAEAASGWGGQEIRIFQECQLLLERGHRVSVVCQSNSPLYKKCLAITSPKFNCYPLRMKSSINIFSYRSLSKLIKTIKPDIIHTHSSIDSWLAGIIGNVCGIPVVRSRHISIPITSVPPNSWLYSKIPKKIITSGEVISEIVSSISGVEPDNVKSISAGVDFRKFDFKITGRKIKNELGINSNQ